MRRVAPSHGLLLAYGPGLLHGERVAGRCVVGCTRGRTVRLVRGQIGRIMLCDTCSYVWGGEIIRERVLLGIILGDLVNGAEHFSIVE